MVGRVISQGLQTLSLRLMVSYNALCLSVPSTQFPCTDVSGTLHTWLHAKYRASPWRRPPSVVTLTKLSRSKCKYHTGFCCFQIRFQNNRKWRRKLISAAVCWLRWSLGFSVLLVSVRRSKEYQIPRGLCTFWDEMPWLIYKLELIIIPLWWWRSLKISAQSPGSK